LNELIAEAGSAAAVSESDFDYVDGEEPEGVASEPATRAAIVREQFAVVSRQQTVMPSPWLPNDGPARAALAGPTLQSGLTLRFGPTLQFDHTLQSLGNLQQIRNLVDLWA
jgi:hypothetical protein